MSAAREAAASVCPRCGGRFTCGLKAGSARPCWCASLPALAQLPARHEGCLCPDCLAERIARQWAPGDADQSR